MQDPILNAIVDWLNEHGISASIQIQKLRIPGNVCHAVIPYITATYANPDQNTIRSMSLTVRDGMIKLSQDVILLSDPHSLDYLIALIKTGEIGNYKDMGSYQEMTNDCLQITTST